MPTLYVGRVVVSQERRIQMLTNDFSPGLREGRRIAAPKHLGQRVQRRQHLIDSVPSDDTVSDGVRDIVIMRLDFDDINDKFAAFFSEAQEIGLLSRMPTCRQPSTRILRIEAYRKSAWIESPIPAHCNQLSERTLDMFALLSADQAKDSVWLHSYLVAH